MRKIVFLLLVFAATRSVAQDCKGYYYLQNNKTVETTVYNRKGEVTARQVIKVNDAKESGGTTTATLHSEVFDKKGKSVATGTNAVKCKGGVMMMDIKMFLPQQQADMMKNAEASASDVFIEYPPGMKTGDALKDASFSMDMTSNGLKQSMSMSMTNRMVAGKESVTTSAGTWECFKITYKTDISIKTMGIGIPISSDMTEWFAPGFGIVKTESKYGTTAVTAIQ